MQYQKLVFLIFVLFIFPSQAFGAVITDPKAAGHPTAIMYDGSVKYDGSVVNDNSVIPKGGVIKEQETKAIEKHILVEPLLLDLSGVGDICTIGTPTITQWQITPDAVINNKETLRKVLETAFVNDTRLRRVSIFDNRIDLYYLMPAYRLKIIPVNYQLHIVADSNTLRMSLENPKWVAKVRNEHAFVSSAFGLRIPELLSDTVVLNLGGAPLAMRDAKMIEVISEVMRGVAVVPHTGTVFSCYIMPFLVYIIGAVIIALFLLWYMIRRVRKLHRRRKLLGLMGGIGEDEEDDKEDDDNSSFPKIRYVPGRPDQ